MANRSGNVQVPLDESEVQMLSTLSLPDQAAVVASRLGAVHT